MTSVIGSPVASLISLEKEVVRIGHVTLMDWSNRILQGIQFLIVVNICNVPLPFRPIKLECVLACPQEYRSAY